MPGEITVNLLFERIRLQAHFRQLFDEIGIEAGWSLIQRAVELESHRQQISIPRDDQQQQEEPCEY